MPEVTTRLADELRISAPPPSLRRRDLVLVVALVLLHVDEVIDSDTLWPAATLATGSIAAMATLIRRSNPLAGVLIAFGAQTVVDFWAGTLESEVLVTSAHLGALVTLIYSLARWAPLRDVGIGLGVLAVVGIVGEYAVPEGKTTTEFGTVLLWCFIAALALAMRYRARLGGYQRAETRHEERERIARELHDVVAHHVSAIAIQAQAAQSVIHQNPVAAQDTLEAIHSSASTALTEMRRMVTLLREPSRAGELTPTPGPDAIKALTQSLAGELTANVTIVGDLEKLPATVNSAVYRIVQEALTNVVRHARRATKIWVNIDCSTDVVVLEVADNGATPGSSRVGFGIVGMTERMRI
ncbi:MAG: hypothetical protein GXP35_11850, partial [Actinobacteria bacterium]|nr:hypothetical protein [Actinomycetota bacterium]